MDVNSIQGLYGATPVTSAETKIDADKGFQSMLAFRIYGVYLI